MSIWRLVLREIGYRKLNFGLGVVAVLAAVACAVGAIEALRAHERRTDRIIAAKEAETAQAVRTIEEQTDRDMRKLEDDYRKITKDLGFNVLILPKDQNLAEFYADDYAAKTMPESYAEKLAQARVVTIAHLLPTLHQKLKWPEAERTIILIGTRSEVPILHQDPKKPILDPVPPGMMVVGHELHRSLKLAVGDKVRLLGRDFKVHKLHPERGNEDDITIWINLREAQELLGKPGQINAIRALECNCSADRLAMIREEIAGVLPDTQVIELVTQALARAEARNRAASAARSARDQAAGQAHAALERERKGQDRLQAEHEDFALVLVPVVVAGAMVWLGLLAFGNVCDRAGEIGILRALGVGSVRIAGLFLAKAVLVGLAGAPLGFAVGHAVGLAQSEEPNTLDAMLLLVVLGIAPALCALTSAIPAIMAARQDPAVILREG